MMILLAAAAFAVPTATPEELAVLATGGTVVRTLVPPNSTSVKVLGMVDVHASKEAVWSVLLDFPGRLPSNPNIVLLEPYQPAVGNEQWWAFTVQKFGMTIVYHNHYVIDRGAGRLQHNLDSTQTNDIAGSSGLYELGECVVPSGACTRLFWTVQTDFGKALPGFVKNWLGRAAVEGFLGDMAARGPSY